MNQVLQNIDSNTSHTETLKQAFEFFSQASNSLTDSYMGLEQKVIDLNDQLIQMRTEKMREFEKRIELSNRMYHLLQALPGGIVVINKNGYVTECNPAANELFGEELIGLLWNDIVEESFSTSLNYEHDMQLKDGRFVNVSTQSLEPESGQIMLIKDVTETRRLHSQVAHMKRLSSMGEMAASLAHQVRTPLSSAILYASTMSRNSLSEEQQEKFSEKLSQSLKSLESLVDDMLLFARGGQLDAKPIVFSELVQSLVNEYDFSKTNTKEVDIVFSDSSSAKMINANPVSIKSALRNIINNAIEFCANPGEVKIILFESDSNLVLEIADDGEGIKKQEAEHVFEPFYTTRAGGTGLGLAVSEAIIRAHQGKIGLQDKTKKGACFYIELPLLKNQKAA